MSLSVEPGLVLLASATIDSHANFVCVADVGTMLRAGRQSEENEDSKHT